ncbi:hypothetical protein GCM10007304_14230 [Rhodococcoides trifolii]|uniref:Uncharacterized protein n=1 Tax=Rhodococcoides trifolii TaxID=908250 RepID=A0A917CZU3_9NOCA|nr:hypothetical protein [Rhodococcus trifolii]GGG01410.1 hypothetical protein GCM10007304_14230 [Rhodococcus trifolii]
MTEIRIPHVSGVAGGVGTTLAATLLDIRSDYGVRRHGETVDVLVCRSVPSQIAQSIAASMSQGRPPVLVVVDDGPLPWPRTSKQRIEMARPNIPHIVRIPWIDRLRSLDDPHASIFEALHGHDYLDELPRWIRPVQIAAEQLTAAVTAVLTTREKAQQ